MSIPDLTSWADARLPGVKIHDGENKKVECWSQAQLCFQEFTILTLSWSSNLSPHSQLLTHPFLFTVYSAVPQRYSLILLNPFSSFFSLFSWEKNNVLIQSYHVQALCLLFVKFRLTFFSLYHYWLFGSLRYFVLLFFYFLFIYLCIFLLPYLNYLLPCSSTTFQPIFLSFYLWFCPLYRLRLQKTERKSSATAEKEEESVRWFEPLNP